MKKAIITFLSWDHILIEITLDELYHDFVVKSQKADKKKNRTLFLLNVEHILSLAKIHFSHWCWISKTERITTASQTWRWYPIFVNIDQFLIIIGIKVSFIFVSKHISLPNSTMAYQHWHFSYTFPKNEHFLRTCE